MKSLAQDTQNAGRSAGGRASPPLPAVGDSGAPWRQGGGGPVPTAPARKPGLRLRHGTPPLRSIPPPARPPGGAGRRLLRSRHRPLRGRAPAPHHPPPGPAGGAGFPPGGLAERRRAALAARVAASVRINRPPAGRGAVSGCVAAGAVRPPFWCEFTAAAKQLAGTGRYDVASGCRSGIFTVL